MCQFRYVADISGYIVPKYVFVLRFYLLNKPILEISHKNQNFFLFRLTKTFESLWQYIDTMKFYTRYNILYFQTTPQNLGHIHFIDKYLTNFNPQHFYFNLEINCFIIVKQHCVFKNCQYQCRIVLIVKYVEELRVVDEGIKQP